MTAAKAYVAAAISLLGSLGIALEDGRLSPAEVVIALGAGLTALSATYWVPNRPE